MKVNALSKGLVVLAFTSQVAFGGVSYEATKDYVKKASDSAILYAQKGYETAKPHVQNAYAVVAQKAQAGVNHMAEASKPVMQGFVNGAMVLFDRSGAAKLWVNNHDACVVGLTLTGVAAVYAACKYYKACKAQRKIKELKKQGYKVLPS